MTNRLRRITLRIKIALMALSMLCLSKLWELIDQLEAEIGEKD